MLDSIVALNKYLECTPVFVVETSRSNLDWQSVAAAQWEEIDYRSVVNPVWA